MKKILLIIAAALLISVTACDKSNNNSNSGTDSTKAGADTTKLKVDTLATKIGTFFGSRYKFLASDTTQKDFSKDEFMRGFKEAYEENTSYALGKQAGQAMAQQLLTFEQQFGTAIDKDVLLNAIAQVFNSKDSVSEADLQKMSMELQQILLKAQQSQVANKQAQLNAAQAAKQVPAEQAPAKK